VIQKSDNGRIWLKNVEKVMAVLQNIENDKT
jgi:hypothetical protein